MKPLQAWVEGDDFHHIVDVFAPDRGDVLALIEAFFDESYDERTLCVAGYAFRKSKLKALDAAWRKMLAIEPPLPFFHMVDCAHGSWPFDALTKDQRIEREKMAIALIRAHAGCGFAVTVDQTAFDDLAPKLGFDATAYEFCAYLGLIGVMEWLDGQTGGDHRVAYVFEGGHANQEEANRMMAYIGKSPNASRQFRYLSHSFVSKDKSRPVQAADLLAWQWFSDAKRHRDGTKPEPRKDLMALIGGDRPRHIALHCDGDLLTEMIGRVRQFRGQSSGGG